MYDMSPYLCVHVNDTFSARVCAVKFLLDND